MLRALMVHAAYKGQESNREGVEERGWWMVDVKGESGGIGDVAA